MLWTPDMVEITHYLDLRITSYVGVPAGAILSRAFEILHCQVSGGYAACFPNALRADKSDIENPKSPTLGDRLRIYGPEHLLKAISSNAGIEALHDYIRAERVMSVGRSSQHVVCKRVRDAAMTEAARNRLLRRAAKRAEARGSIIVPADLFQKGSATTDLPYINIASRSTGQKFRMHIENILVGEATPGEFDSYGLSKNGATVPVL